ncbi:MAG: sulfatase [Lentisphaerae bacterium]|nr:sulfatase [Lentisphaerota bacterium]
MRTILVLLDSLNRDYLAAYGNDWVKTPNLTRLAARSVVFDRHYTSSMPCMPARRDLMTGRLSFLEAPWGPLEPWDHCAPKLLRKQKNVYSHMITDHYHYFHSGGEVYNTLFDSFEFERGQEGDKWRGVVETTPLEGRGKNVNRQAYLANFEYRDLERDEDYPFTKCISSAAEFLKRNRAADNWHLHLELFDPHEPFESPQRFHDMYDDTWDKYFFTSPEYGKLDPEFDDAEAVTHIQRSYAANLTMLDQYLGQLFDVMDEYGMWDDTALILSTDHGHNLGERGVFGKSMFFDSEIETHIPLLISAPGCRPGRRQALTGLFDLMPTLMELHDAGLPPHVQGRSMCHLLQEDGEHHDALLFGYFGKDVNLADGRHTYCRQPERGAPVHHYSLMPRGYGDFVGSGRLKAAEVGCFLKSSDGIPQLRFTHKSRRHLDAPEGHIIHDVLADPQQQHRLTDPALEERLAAKLTELLQRYDAPPCHLERLGLKRAAP